MNQLDERYCFPGLGINLKSEDIRTRVVSGGIHYQAPARDQVGVKVHEQDRRFTEEDAKRWLAFQRTGPRTPVALANQEQTNRPWHRTGDRTDPLVFFEALPPSTRASLAGTMLHLITEATMSNRRVSPMLAKLLESTENRVAFERERSVSEFPIGIEETMSDQKISKARFAEKIGKKAQAIGRAMQGKQNLTIGTMVEIAVALGKTIDLKVIDLPILQAVTESKTTCLRESQIWATEYTNKVMEQQSFTIADNFVHGDAYGVS